jgi:hypothetical protein
LYITLSFSALAPAAWQAAGEVSAHGATPKAVQLKQLNVTGIVSVVAVVDGVVPAKVHVVKAIGPDPWIVSVVFVDVSVNAVAPGLIVVAVADPAPRPPSKAAVANTTTASFRTSRMSDPFNGRVGSPTVGPRRPDGNAARCHAAAPAAPAR